MTKLCYQCLLAEGLKISQPQILKVYKGCDWCERAHTMTWSLEEVRKQGKA